jgi:hypothetical protein
MLEVFEFHSKPPCNTIFEFHQIRGVLCYEGKITLQTPSLPNFSIPSTCSKEGKITINNHIGSYAYSIEKCNNKHET